MPEKPDLEEAKELISRAVLQARGIPRMLTGDEAAEVLMGELAALDGHEGIEFKRHQRQMFMTLGAATATITYHATHGVQILVNGVIPIKVVLDHDPATGRFIGTDPGAPNRQRPAVAVVVEAAINALHR